MKQHPVAGKTGRRTTNSGSSPGSAGSQALALAPPAYGIALADRGPGAGGAVQRLEEQDALVRPGDPAAAPPPSHPTSLPDRLKSSIERLSGVPMDHVKVHYDSPRPARFQALAYAQGSDIHVAPGQERHLPHEAWHVVQQAQGRVQPTSPRAGGVAVNDDHALEREADVMSARALTKAPSVGGPLEGQTRMPGGPASLPPILARRAEDVSAHAASCACPACAGGRHLEPGPQSPLTGSYVRPQADGLREPTGQGTALPGGPVFQFKCKLCGAKSHNESSCPKNENKKETKKSGRGLTKAGKTEKAWLEHLLNHPNWDSTMMYGSGAKSIIGGYKGKPNGLDDSSIRIDRQGLGNVQFQASGSSYACAVFEQEDEPAQVLAALRRSIQSGQNETVG